MTDETFEMLAQYEELFVRVKARQYQPYPGRTALQNMVKAIREIRPNYHTNLGCSSCVRSLALECAGMYFTEKDARQKAANAARTDEIPVETAKTVETTGPKKKARKTKKDA